MNTVQRVGMVAVLFVLVFTLFGYKSIKERLSSHGIQSGSIGNRKSTLQEGTTVLKGDYQCNKYSFTPSRGEVYQTGIDLPTNTIMNTCLLENVCLTTSGEFVLFHRKEHFPTPQSFSDWNGKPWVYAQGKVTSSKRGNFNLNLEDADLVVRSGKDKIEGVSLRRKTTCNSNDCEKFETIPAKIHDQFTIISEPVYAFYRFAVGNVGHIFLENINNVMNLMMNYNPSLLNSEQIFDNRILFLDDVYDITGDSWMGSYKYNLNQSSRLSIEVASLFSNRETLQVCNKENEVTIEKAPCKNVPFSKPSERVLQTCFSKFHIGTSSDLLAYYQNGRESVFVHMKNLIYQKLKLPQPANNDERREYLKTKDIRITIHKKSLSDRHGSVIYNADELLSHLTEMLPTNPDIKQLMQDRQLIVEFINLYNMSVPDQIRYYSTVDVYITDGGSASYYSLFMTEGSSVLSAPSCNPGCVRGFTNILETWPHIRVKNIVDLAPTTCITRFSTVNQQNCDPVLQKEAVLSYVLSSLKYRYQLISE